MIEPEEINQLIGVGEYYQAPHALQVIMLNRDKRVELFKKFLAVERDLSYDWFRSYFQQQQADRGNNKQDFTPVSISKLLAMLSGPSQYNMDFATGTGGITIQKWYSNQQAGRDTSEDFYWMEEITEAAIPFLLFNTMIRGMNAVVINGDSLERTANQIYLVQNAGGTFSSLNVLPHNEKTEEQYEIAKWTADPIDHTETSDDRIIELPVVDFDNPPDPAPVSRRKPEAGQLDLF